MIEYHKIYGPFKRETEGPNRNKIIIDDWTKPEFEYLKDNLWTFTEKIDGTNIRVGWDGHRVEFGGRTDNAQIPAKLIAKLQELFPEELFEQAFGENDAILFGEGYGAGIQRGGNYRQDMSFILFDVRVGGWWLKREGIENVATKFGIDVVPIVAERSLTDMIEGMKSYNIRSTFGAFDAEGVVGTPTVPLFTRSGERIIIKIKSKDFK